jgi:hypothetical protein
MAVNTYGHAARETRDRLTPHKATLYRTDLNGTVVLTSDCSTYTIGPSVPLPQATPPPAAPPPPPPPPPLTSSCDSCHPDVCIPIGAADRDCTGGSGNGPNYIQGPVRVVCHPDPHGPDHNGDGWGCE